MDAQLGPAHSQRAEMTRSYCVRGSADKQRTCVAHLRTRCTPCFMIGLLAQMPAAAVQALQHLDRLDDGANEALRFPLSASEPREDPDHLGAAATVIDCVFNSAVVGVFDAQLTRVWLARCALCIAA